MFDRNFITVPRVLDEAPMHCRIDDIVMVTVNADEHGPQEGTCAIYFRYGLAIAANMPVEEVVALIKQKEVTQ